MRLAIFSGMPTSCAMVRASSSARDFRLAEIFSRYCARSLAPSALQACNAPRAALTAASTSFSVPAGTRPMTSPVPALCTSMVSLPEAATHWPPMKRRSRTSMALSWDRALFYIYSPGVRQDTEISMSRKARAVICRELEKPVVVEEISVEPPRRGEVTVKLAACGVCHSDLSATNGTLAMQLPLILGHEAAGEVVEVGEGVTELKQGDHVVSSFIYMCGECRFCAGGRPVLCIEQGKAVTTLPDGTVRTRDAKGQPLNIFSGCGVMAEYATMHVDNLVKIDPKIPFDRAALVGCAVTTGVGAVFNTARVAPGSSVAVFGCGGVGLNVIQGARIAGAGRIIAIDTLQAKLEMAKEFGATDGILVSQGEDVAKSLKKLTGGGPDYAFECVGNGE